MIQLTNSEIQSIEERIKTFETKTGTELLLVITNASDPYPGASLRFGVVSSLLTTLVISYYIELSHQSLWPLIYFGNFIFFSWIGHFSWAKKMALSTLETERECSEKALEFFHTLGTQKVSHQATVMIMLSLLEKKVEILVDEKIKEKIVQADLDELMNLMITHFKQKQFSQGLEKSIESLESKIIQKFSGKVLDTPPENLSNVIHFKLL